MIKGKLRKVCASFGVVFCAILTIFSSISANALISQEYARKVGRDGSFLYNGEADDCQVTRLSGDSVTWIGDSYSEGAESGNAGGKLISTQLPGVDIGDFNYGGSQSAESYLKSGKGVNYDAGADNPGGIKILKSIKEAGKLRPYLVFALAANNGITAENIDEIVSIAGSNTQIVFVNLYMTTDDSNIQNYIKTSNEALKQAESRHKNVHVADWAGIAKAEYYANDPSGVHPFGGYKEWVKVIYDTLVDAAGGSSSSGGSSKSSINRGQNKNYAGEQVWSDVQLKIIEKNRSVYEKAAKETGVPWQAIATMHSLETNLERANPANGQGIYQLYSYTSGGTNGNAFLPAGPVSESEFERQTLIAAREMKRIVEGEGLDVSSDDGVKALLFAYNGKSDRYIEKALKLGFSAKEAKIGEGSPYVMNRYDAKRDPRSNSMDPAWPGRFVADGVFSDTAVQYDFGGFVKYVALGGGNGGNGYCTSQGGNMDLNQTAIDLAWSEADHQYTYSRPKDTYLNAMKETGLWDEGGHGIFNRGDGTMIPTGKSCDNFVGTVVRYSGVDDKFPFWLGGQVSYLASSDKWVEVSASNTADIKEGDIRLEGAALGHISMVVKVNGELKIASASSGERYGDIGNYYQTVGKVYRLK